MRNKSRLLREENRGNGTGILMAAVIGAIGIAAIKCIDSTKKKKKVADSLEDINPDDDLQFVDDMDDFDNEDM